MGIEITREGPVAITRQTIEAAWRRRAKGKRLIIRDAATPGLALVVNPTSARWIYEYKPRGTDSLTSKRFATRSLTIGGPDSHGPEAARGEARSLRNAVAAGGDPQAAKRAAQAEKARDLSLTMGRLIENYLGELPHRAKLRGDGLPSRRYVENEAAALKAAMAILRAEAKPVSEMVADDVDRMLRAIPATQAAKRRAFFGALSRFFDWCIDEKSAITNPCAGVKKQKRPKGPKARSDFLTMPEIALLWHAAGKIAPDVHRDLARFLFLVPCRRIEAATMDWADVNLANAHWDQPAHLTKNGDPHRLHLHRLALDLLRGRHEAMGKPRAGLVFPAPWVTDPKRRSAATKESDGVLKTFSKLKNKVSAAADGFTSWRWHAIRRSFATHLGEAGIAESVADGILNHRQSATRGGVLGVYQTSQRWGERRAVMHTWGAMLEAAIKGADPESNVVPLRA
jgi:integrase